MLLGRRDECAMLDELLEAARGGRSAVLVVRGEPGIGKTELLRHALGSATGFGIARALGVEAEAELPFAALHQLCVPMLERFDELAGPQRDALGAAFGLSAGTAPEPFLIGLATISLLSATATGPPLLCVVDDAQWLDRASAQVLAFVARRLLADPIAMVFATRESDDAFAGLPELIVEGLSVDDARALVAATVRGPLDERVRDRIIAETRGNPLALVELPKAATPAELGLGLATRGSLAGRIEDGFRRRVDDLPADTRRLLLLASADALGDPVTVWRAAQSLGIGAEAATPAADAELMDIGARVRFRHPLVRSAVYGGATLRDRQAVHRALAGATDAGLDPDRRIWHLAAATAGLDDDVAAELSRSAGRAQVRGGPAAAAAFLERSAELTTDSQLRAARMLQAAGAQLTAGANHRARRLLEPAVGVLTDPMARAQAMRMDGAIRFMDGRGGDTPSLLFDAAMALRDLDPRLARETLMEAFEAAMWAGALTTGTTTLDVARAAREIPVPDPDESAPSLMLTGYSERLTRAYAAGIDPWRRAIRANAAAIRRQPTVQWQGMVWNMCGELLDFERQLATGRQRVRMARELGALGDLPIALSCLAWNEVQAGRIHVGEVMVADAIEIAAATGNPSMPGAQELMRAATLPWSGHVDEARAYLRAAMAEAARRGQGLAITLCRAQLVQLELALGQYGEARVNAAKVFEDDPVYIGSITLADAVEAMTRSGDIEGAQRALARLSERASAADTPWALGLLARARALMADDRDAEALYIEAVEELERSSVLTDLARARLLYGEWLRRQRRRRDARTALRTAFDMFRAMGAELYAQRASVELAATGEHARTRDPASADELTPQERQVAELAAAGDSNAAIAAQLYISPHTVAYHLRKVYTKLGVTSRRRLDGALGGRLRQTAAGR